MKTKLDIINEITTDWQYQKVKVGKKLVILDGTTASIIKQVYDALSEANKAKYMAMDWQTIINFAFKAIKQGA